MENITKVFTGTVALDEVSIKLYRGEILAIVGENGAGKSTLMRILSGSYDCTEFTGTIISDDLELRFQSIYDAQIAGIVMIPQELCVELDLTVAENIMLGQLPVTKSGMVDWKKTKRIASEALENLKADIDINSTVRNLSPSMQQIVCIARAIVRKPHILILDEPTSVLTDNETENLMRILRSLKKEGISCIFISHRLDEIFQLCDRLIVLRDGKYISTHTRSEGYDSDRIVEDIIGRKLSVMYPSVQKELGNEIFRIDNYRVPHPYAYGKSILEDVSLSLRKGEILGLAGLVGSGRSELVNAIFGVTQKTKGKTYIYGKKTNIKDPWDAKRLGIGLLTENRSKNGFISTMTVKNNISVTILDKLRKLLMIDFNKEHQITSDISGSLRIKTPGMETLITHLSGGNQQKVILAKWLITDSSIIFMDEPTRGIDIGAKADIYRIITDLAKKGKSIILISSELQELLALCDRIIVLANGRVRAELARNEATEAQILRMASNV